MQQNITNQAVKKYMTSVSNLKYVFFFKLTAS